MLRNVLGVIAGIVVGIAVVSAIEFGGHQIYPPPPGIDPMDPEDLKAWLEVMPIGAMVAVLIAHAVGSFAGTSAAVLAAQRRALPGWIVGAVFLAFTVMNLFMIPSPPWFIAADLALVVLAPVLAVRLFSRRAAA